jgi:hypothetical protein
MTRDAGLGPRVLQHPRLSGEEWELRRQIAGRHTSLYEYVNAGREDRRVFMKRFPVPAGGGVDRRLVREYRALRVLERKLGSDLSHTVPAPLVMFPAEHFVVMGGVPGAPLVRILKRDANRVTGLVRRGVLRRSGRAVGAWLAAFHDHTRRPDIPHDHGAFWRDVEADLDRLVEPRSTAFSGQVRRICEASRRLEGRPLRAAGRHADFLPQNILVNGTQVSVVDFENYRPRDVAHKDIGSFLGYLALLEHRWPYLPRALRAVRDGFLDAYGGSSAGVDQQLYTAAAVIRIARDTGTPGVRRHLVRVVSALPL